MLLVDKIEYCTAQKKSACFIAIDTNVFMLLVSYIAKIATFRLSALIFHIGKLPMIIGKRHTPNM